VQLSALLAMFALFTAQIVSALLPNVPVFIAASAAGLALDVFLQYRDPGLLALLGKVRFDVTVRQLLRDMLILVGLLRIEGIDPTREQAPLLSRCASSTPCTSPARPPRSWSAAPVRCRSSPATSTRPRCA
jgi:hypothetical protein